MTDFKKGDTVRLLPGEFEAGSIYNSPGETGIVVLLRKGRYLGEVEVTQVEKVEPPVEVFKPGDVVRSKGGHLYTVATNGYLDHSGSRVYTDCQDTFTSEGYEKINLVEAPF